MEKGIKKARAIDRMMAPAVVITALNWQGKATARAPVNRDYSVGPWSLNLQFHSPYFFA
jgi:hypothetical protein